MKLNKIGYASDDDLQVRTATAENAWYSGYRVDTVT
jgi:hypothetical protein